jgi:glutamyl-Q tRNA(Asp) synthetase
MADDILRTLEALGFAWDGELVWQSLRTAAYEAALAELARKGMVYPCGCSRAEILRIGSAPHGRAEELCYPGLCRNGLPAGKSPRAIRVRVTDAPVTFMDGVMGEVTENLAESCGDFVVKRADGPFAYQLAVVVDDVEAGVNQVVRGADLLHSTPRQIYLQQLLGFASPGYCHLPLVTGPNGAKLSKRENAISLAKGRNLQKEGGTLLLASLRFLGQTPPVSLEKASCPEILDWGATSFYPAVIPQRLAPLTWY